MQGFRVPGPLMSTPCTSQPPTGTKRWQAININQWVSQRYEFWSTMGGLSGLLASLEWKSEKWAHSLKRGFLYPCNKEEIPLGREKRGHWKIRHLSGHTEFAFHYVNTTKTKQTRTSPETTLLNQHQIYVFTSFSLLFTALQGLHWNL